MLKWARNYFGFSKAETYGSIVIFFFMGIMIISTPLYEMYLAKSKLPVSAEILDSLATKPSIQKSRKDTLFIFDPNTISGNELKLLGLPDYLVTRYQKFIKAGGRFYKASDLYKIYGVDSAWVLKVSSYVKIRREKKLPDKNSKTEVNKTIAKPLIRHDINLADTTVLKKVRGIGSVLSKRIIKFRDKLGGFVSIDQLGEVYGLSPEVFAKLKEVFFVEDNFKPQYIEINKWTKEQLASHPYIDFKLAQLILKYRSQHYPLKSPEELLQIPKMSGERLNKIKPYLSFEY